jgi:hypothetical protein
MTMPMENPPHPDGATHAMVAPTQGQRLLDALDELGAPIDVPPRGHDRPLPMCG